MYPDDPRTSITVGNSGLPVPTQKEEWQALGFAFDGMCKVGLALTVGFSVAAAFCKVMESGKVKIPNMVTSMAQQIMDSVPTEPEQKT